MDYDPADHVPTSRQVSGAWIACVLMSAAVFGGHWAVHRARAVTAAAHAHAAPGSPQLCQRHEPALHDMSDHGHPVEASQG